MKSTFRRLFASAMACALAFAIPVAATAHSKLTVLHSFGSGADGQGPEAGVIDMNGTLYGTTHDGGANNIGTVFAIDRKTGAETVIHSFCHQTGCVKDGEYPQAALIAVKGILYGVTQNGGRYVGGTAFSLDPNTGAENVLYEFCHKGIFVCQDGRYPLSSMIAMNGKLYGTTEAGGDVNCQNICGTIFSIDPASGKEKVLFQFCGDGGGLDCPDGADPLSSLIEMNGTFYGVTADGGVGGPSCGTSGCGTLFSINPKTGKEKVLYSFCQSVNCADGSFPQTALIAVNGILYGTTMFGGNPSCRVLELGCGTVFSLDPNTGTETVLHAFTQSEGAYPFAPLINVKGTPYGTASGGGVAGCDNYGCGAVFSIDPTTGAEKTLYHFCSQQNCADGDTPQAALLEVGGVLYGTARYGGANDEGTVFALKP